MDVDGGIDPEVEPARTVEATRAGLMEAPVVSARDEEESGLVEPIDVPIRSRSRPVERCVDVADS
jgi:hypothetical protein